MISTTVMIRYIPYKIRAVDIAFGTSLSFSGPGTSARIRYIEFFLSNDISTSTNTSTPIPPIQCVKLRQIRTQCGRTSTSVRMLEPVVVNPETVSKSASTGCGIYPLTTKGSAPKTHKATQLRATATQPSLV